LIYDLEDEDDALGLFKQIDSPLNSLRRDSAELFIKETIPSLKLKLVSIINHLKLLF
jgi:RAB6A-GEF complex partner protein 1